MKHKNEKHQTFGKMSSIRQANGIRQPNVQTNTQSIKISYLKYILGLLLFGLNGIVSSKINLSSMNIVLFRTLFGSVLLVVIYLIGRGVVGKKKSKEKLEIGWEKSGVGREKSETGREKSKTGRGKLETCREKSETNREISETDRAESKSSDVVWRYKKQLIFVILSGIAMGLSWIFLYEAYARIGVGLSSITYYCGPVIVMIVTPLVFKKKITLLQKICFSGVFVGIILVSVPDLISDVNMDGFGLLCGFISAVLHALMVIFTMKAPDITGEKNATIQLVVSFLTVAVFALFKGGVAVPKSHTEWFWLLFLGLINTGVGCYLYFCDIAKLPVISVSILGYLEPLSAVIFAVILLGERLSVFELVGGVLILIGAAIASVKSEA